MNMGQRDSVGAVAIGIPVIVCMSLVMAAQSVEVRRGYSPDPQPRSEADSNTTPSETLQVHNSGGYMPLAVESATPWVTQQWSHPKQAHIQPTLH
jgi:hypothetical protein